MIAMCPSSSESETFRRIERAVGGDQQAWTELIGACHARLRSMVAIRIDQRLHGRIDPSDVIQEAYLDALRRLSEYRDQPEVPFYIWLRFLVEQRLAEQHRRHLGAAARDAGREISMHRRGLPCGSTAALAAQLLGKLPSPSEEAIYGERKLRLQEALNKMSVSEREIILLRNYEQLSNGEAAKVLGLDKSTTSKRYIRALFRLKQLLVSLGFDPIEDDK